MNKKKRIKWERKERKSGAIRKRGDRKRGSLRRDVNREYETRAKVENQSKRKTGMEVKGEKR